MFTQKPISTIGEGDIPLAWVLATYCTALADPFGGFKATSKRCEIIHAGRVGIGYGQGGCCPGRRHVVSWVFGAREWISRRRVTPSRRTSFFLCGVSRDERALTNLQISASQALTLNVKSLSLKTPTVAKRPKIGKEKWARKGARV
jgi:hypothetical protein